MHGSCLHKATDEVSKKTKEVIEKISSDSGNPLNPKDSTIGKKFWSVDF
jgi:hypothetical protein